ncbi:MAG: sugar ABC transporter permease [Planctomycetota bacterium]|nr:sugar ABC transporter permease [Planctomycetota bacterium]
MSVYNRRPLWLRLRPYLIILPALALTIGILYPFITAIYYSLTSLNLQRPHTMRFIWFNNWIRMFSDRAFWHAVRVTLQYAIIATGLEMALGLGVALLITRRDSWFTRLLKVSLVFPLMIAPVVAVIIWQLMTSNSIGIIEKLLNIFGIYNFPWASSAKTAMFTAILIDVWVYTPFIFILVVAGINSLPKSPFEAAKVDGASDWFTFKNLTLPMLKPFLYIALIFRLMAAMQEYAIIFSLTRGGPGDTLMNLSVSAYIRGFTQYRFGQMIPYVLFLWVVIFIVSQILVRRWLKVQKQAAGR